MIPDALVTALSLFGWSWLAGTLLSALHGFHRGLFQASRHDLPPTTEGRRPVPGPTFPTGLGPYIRPLPPSAMDEYFRPSPRMRQRERQPGSRCRVCAHPRAEGDHANCR